MDVSMDKVYGPLNAAIAEADRLRLERGALAEQLAAAMKLLQAVGACRRNRNGRRELSTELERAVEAFTTQTPWVAYFAARERTANA